MKIYLAGTSCLKDAFLQGCVNPKDCNILESFYSIQDWQTTLIPQFKSFLLDSGAFTFLNSQKTANKDFEKYADAYADFIKTWDVKRYFELDIDSIVGLSEVERLRKRIESRTGVLSIPVWHKGRGKDYYVRMCKEYPYVAIGGIVIQEASRDVFEKAFPWFINIAHENGSRVHALRYTQFAGLRRFRFDSVDSTSWSRGSRWGEVCVFKPNEQRIRIVNGRELGGKRRLRDTDKTAIHNFSEWVKFSNYMERMTSTI